jgi:hypothetical protein
MTVLEVALVWTLVYAPLVFAVVTVSWAVITDIKGE